MLLQSLKAVSLGVRSFLFREGSNSSFGVVKAGAVPWTPRRHIRRSPGPNTTSSFKAHRVRLGFRRALGRESRRWVAGRCSEMLSEANPELGNGRAEGFHNIKTLVVTLTKRAHDDRFPLAAHDEEAPRPWASSSGKNH